MPRRRTRHLSLTAASAAGPSSNTGFQQRSSLPSLSSQATTGSGARSPISVGSVLASSSTLRGVSSAESNPHAIDHVAPESTDTWTSSELLTPTSSAPEQDQNTGGTQGEGDELGDVDSESSSVGPLTPTSSLAISDDGVALENREGESDIHETLQTPANLQSSNESTSIDQASQSTALWINPSRYNVRDEEPLSVLPYQSEFRIAFEIVSTTMDELADVLASGSLHEEPDTRMHTIHTEADNLTHVQWPSTRTVGFVGYSGAGKSSLINSLLDFNDLARTSNSGACTCVVTEYHYRDQDDFTVDVELFTNEEIMEQLSELLEPYRQYYGRDIDDLGIDEINLYETRAYLAHDTFSAMFGGQMGDDSFLIQEEVEVVLNRLQTMVDDMRPSDIAGVHIVLTVEDCSELLMAFTSERRSSPLPNYWPYIKKVKVSMNAHALSSGLVLVDLPGLGNVNTACSNITKCCMVDYDEIFVICDIGRATTDERVMSMISMAREADLQNVSIVCMKSDDINASELRRAWQEPRAERIDEINRRIVADQEELRRIEVELTRISESVQSQGTVELFRNFMVTKNRISDRKFELYRYLITTRNMDIESSLVEQYLPEIPGDELKVFCVSSRDYWKVRNQPRDNALPTLQLSGVLGLRKYCTAIVAERQRHAAENYILNQIPTLLSRIERWIRSGAGRAIAEQRRLACRTIAMIKTRIAVAFYVDTSQINNIAQRYKAEFMGRVYQLRDTQSWSEVAANAAIGWSGLHHATYSAFCRHDGVHTPRGHFMRNLNEEAVQGMSSDLMLPWQSLSVSLHGQNRQMRTVINQVMIDAINYFNTQLPQDLELTDVLRSAVETHRQLLIADIQYICGRLDAKLHTLGFRALSGGRNSLIARAMQSSYDECKRQYGLGSDRRRKWIIQSRLSREDFFEDLMLDFRDDFYNLMDKFQNRIQQVVRSRLDIVQGVLDRVRNENIVLEADRDPEFHERVEEKTRSARDEIRRITETIDRFITLQDAANER